MENKRKFVDMCDDIITAKKYDTVEAAGIAMVADNKVFLIKPFSTKGKRMWGIPKGHVENGETLEMTARREFEEEVGFGIKGEIEYLGKSGYLGNGNFPSKNIHAFIGYGTGDERFKGSNLITSGKSKGNPENVDGQYFDIKETLSIIHGSQISLMELLIEKLNL